MCGRHFQHNEYTRKNYYYYSVSRSHVYTGTEPLRRLTHNRPTNRTMGNLGRAIHLLFLGYFSVNGFLPQNRRLPGRIATFSTAEHKIQLDMLPSADVISETLPFLSNTLLANSGEQIVSPDPIHSLFSVATFLPQPFWLLMIAFPKRDFTRSIMGDLKIPLLCALVHFLIVSISITQPDGTAPLAEFNEVFNPSGDPQLAFMGMTRYPNFIAEEWSHVLTWDLFVGRYIWKDGLDRGINTRVSVLFCNLIGPPGLLIHWFSCVLSGKKVYEEQ